MVFFIALTYYSYIPFPCDYSEYNTLHRNNFQIVCGLQFLNFSVGFLVVPFSAFSLIFKRDG